MDMKVCTGCKESKTTAEFYADKRRPDGLYLRCKSCHGAATSSWAKRNAQAKAKHAADYRARHPERAAEIQRRSSNKRYAADPEPQKARTRDWYISNRERAAEYHRQYRGRNAEAKRAYFAAYYQENADILKERARANGPVWARANKDKVTARANRRRAAKLRAIPSWADLGAIDAVYAQCASTSEASGIAHHVDHVVPLQGKIVCGLHVAANLQILPGKENQSKGARTWPDMP